MAGFSTMSGISWAHCSAGRGWVRRGAGVWCCCHIQGYRFHGHCCCGQRGQSPLGLRLEGRCRCCCLGHCCGREARVGVTCPAAPRFSVRFAAVAADPGFQVPPPLFPRSCLLCVFQFIHSFFFFWPCCLWDLSSPTRIKTNQALGSESLAS